MRFNQSKFAKEVGCSQQNISKLIKKGILEVGQDKKLDLEYSLQRLRDFNLLDEKNKLKKSRTSKEDNIQEVESSLPFDSDTTGYKTLADLTPEEKEQLEKEELESFKELEEKKKEAATKNINVGDNIDLKDFNYASAKAHREYYMGQIAELDYQIKLGDYVSKAEVEKTFFEASRKVRDMLLSYPNKMASRIIGKKDIKEIETILLEEIRYILGNLSS
ncbi:hypothetical protein PJV89_05320 [Aliarcobacter butzleri]|uniref:hypothetical protein n=1 Tax=Aliarcobacter butzleri TaxID=28197 RepID=UPI00263CE0D4|nr:hypothetical protein [Aliarcobacter butzleri]MDN5077637.1 hypothetical protein [Aliarcobacter butzleri]MDN5118815.1 hypothetical protein [Aliarcobacter butzleri]